MKKMNFDETVKFTDWMIGENLGVGIPSDTLEELREEVHTKAREWGYRLDCGAVERFVQDRQTDHLEKYFNVQEIADLRVGG